jgi:RimJ/RimL family protein N-acetyltransferase
VERTRVAGGAGIAKIKKQELRIMKGRDVGRRAVSVQLSTESQMSFVLQPTLKGELIELRPLTPGDWDELFSVASDPLIWEQHPESDRYKEDVFKIYFREALESGGAFAIIDKESGKIIGSTRYNGYAPEKSEIEIGWTFLARNYWGGLYNRELKDLMLTHAFKFVESVAFLIGENNIRSQRATERIGATRDGLMTMSDRNGGAVRNRRYVIRRPRKEAFRAVRVRSLEP